MRYNFEKNLAFVAQTLGLIEIWVNQKTQTKDAKKKKKKSQIIMVKLDFLWLVQTVTFTSSFRAPKMGVFSQLLQQNPFGYVSETLFNGLQQNVGTPM